MPLINIIHICLEIWGAIFSLVAAVIVIAGAKSKKSRLLYFMLLANVAELTCDAMAWLFRGSHTVFGFYAVRMSNFGVFAFNYLIALLVTLYTEQLVSGGKIADKRRHNIAIVIFGAGIAVLAINSFTGLLYGFDSGNYYYRAAGYPVILLIGALQFMNALGLLHINRREIPRRDLIAILSYFILPAAAMAVQLFYYGISLVTISATVAIMIIFVNFELEKNRLITEQSIEIAYRDLELAKKDKQLSEKRAQIMLSQIQPHFLYNSLATISSLCIVDSSLAKKAVDYFADYLRMNIDTLKNGENVPFEKELEHIRAYLWLEQLRFGEGLVVEYDVAFKDFTIPPLTVQPLVENAIKHGLWPKEDGGTVSIYTRRFSDFVGVYVKDNGVGFDINEKKNDGREHIGMENVRDRLAASGAQLKINSIKGVGTVAYIFVPMPNTVEDEK